MRKFVLVLIGVIITAFLIWTTYLWKFFKSSFAGSYPTSETWVIPKKQEEVIRAIIELIKEYPELEPPNKRVSSYRTYRYWYLENFHYSDTDEDVEIYLRPTQDSSNTLFGFTTVKQHVDSFTQFNKLVFVPNKDINRDYGYFENKRQIKKFKEKILKPIILKLNIKNEILS